MNSTSSRYSAQAGLVTIEHVSCIRQGDVLLLGDRWSVDIHVATTDAIRKLDGNGWQLQGLNYEGVAGAFDFNSPDQKVSVLTDPRIADRIRQIVGVDRAEDSPAAPQTNDAPTASDGEPDPGPAPSAGGSTATPPPPRITVDQDSITIKPSPLFPYQVRLIIDGGTAWVDIVSEEEDAGPVPSSEPPLSVSFDDFTVFESD